MNAQQEVGRSLSKDVAHAARFTSSAVGTFVRTAGAPIEAMAGGLGAFFGLATAHTAGIAYPLYGSAILDLCGFGGAGLLFAVGTRLLASKGQRAKEERRRTNMMFQSHTLEMQLQTAERLPSWVGKDTREAFAREILQTMSTTSPD